jgi:hypothetical protein
MGLRQVRLDPERFRRRRSCLLHSGRDRLDGVIAPAFQLREARLCEGELWIELDRPFVERLCPRARSS